MSVEFWFLIGAALVFWMQAGFAMVETGFTRAKNAGNIIMKNLMDFCIGTVVFSLLGYTLMMGEDAFFGLIGIPNLDLFTHFKAFIASPAEGFTDASYFVFNLVFCATTATIVSGAMAERTKFSAYCVYSGVISLLIYPIEAHWIWGGGWLSQLGFHDYAGSCAIHMVGGIAALIGAAMLGPRIGKYVRNKDGKVIKVNAIPGHSIPLGALGVFILWLGWYGFNGAAATTPSELSSIFLTTTIAPSVATCTTLIYTWVKNGKPDVSMCLNASLAGLVAVTAGCDAFDAIGAGVVGIVSGILIVIVVEVLDLKLHIDDPVGAVGVHMANGIWGTIAVGLLANPDAPAGLRGLLYTGSFSQLGIQLLDPDKGLPDILHGDLHFFRDLRQLIFAQLRQIVRNDLPGDGIIYLFTVHLDQEAFPKIPSRHTGRVKALDQLQHFFHQGFRHVQRPRDVRKALVQNSLISVGVMLVSAVVLWGFDRLAEMLVRVLFMLAG